MLKSIKHQNDRRAVLGIVSRLRGLAKDLAEVAMCETLAMNVQEADTLNREAQGILGVALRVERMATAEILPETVTIKPGSVVHAILTTGRD